MLDEQVDSFSCTSHVGYFGYAWCLVLDQLACIVCVQFVLGGTRQCDIHFLFPGFLAGIEGRTGEFFGVRSYNIITWVTQFQHIIDLFSGNAVRIIDIAVRAGDRDDFCTQFGSLCGSSPSDVSETGDSNSLTFNIYTMSFQHLVNEVEGTETGCFGTEDRAAEFHTFTCERTGVFASQFLIHTIHITDFTSSYTDVTRRNIAVRSEVTP